MQQQGSNPHPWLPEHTRAVLRDSSWVTLAWDWFQTLLGRAVEAVLWATMIFSCYQLIPGASQPPSQVSSLAFILQFIGLDVGGLGLNKAAQQQGLPRLSYARVIAYILIGITLVTVAYAGIEHAVQMDAHVTAWVEVSLVVARSIMTVLYGQAIHSLKHQGQSSRVRIEELEQEVSTLREQVSSGQAQVSSLRIQLAQRQHAVDTLSVQVSSLLQQVDSGQAELDRWQQQANGGQQELDSLSKRLQAALSEVDGLRAQLGIRQQELAAVRDAWEREQREVSSLREQLTVQQQQVSSYVPPVDSGQPRMDSQQVSSGRVSSSSVHLDTGQPRVDSGQPRSGQVIALSSKKQRRGLSEEQVLVERIRDVLQQEPELSARSIASKVGCSPTTAAKWKALIEHKAQQQDASSRECVND